MLAHDEDRKAFNEIVSENKRPIRTFEELVAWIRSPGFPGWAGYRIDNLPTRKLGSSFIKHV